MPLIGDTIKLHVEFKSFANAYIDPNPITFKVFDYDEVQIGSTINITSSNKISTGIYEYDYIIPNGDSPFITVEFQGSNVEGSVVTIRENIERKWV